MKPRFRVHFGLPVAACCAAALAVSVANSQPLQRRLDVPEMIGTTHHVTGYLQKGTCSSFFGATVRVSEFWYEAKSGDTSTLSLPTGSLTFTGRALTQGRVLGTAGLTSGDRFDVQWTEPASASRVPWVVNAVNGATGETLSVYRILVLRVDTNQSDLLGAVDPVPLIMFFGAETRKNIGSVKVDCYPVG